MALGRTIAELEEGMSSAEFSEWLAYDRVGGVADLNLAQAHVSQTIEARFGGGKPRKLLDCRVLAHEQEREELTPEQTAGVLGRMAAERSQQTGGKTL